MRFTGRYYAEDDTELAQNVRRHKQEGWVDQMGKGECRRSENTVTMGHTKLHLGGFQGIPEKETVLPSSG